MSSKDINVKDSYAAHRDTDDLFEGLLESKCDDKEMLTHFLYTKNQALSEGIIMEVNTVSVGGPGLIEVVDGSAQHLLVHAVSAELTKVLRQIDAHATLENSPGYFQNYIDDILKSYKKRKMIVMHCGLFEEKEGKEIVSVRGDHIRYIGGKKLRPFLEEHKNELSDALLLNYGHGHIDRVDKKLYKYLEELFGDRYLDNSFASLFVNAKLRYPEAIEKQTAFGNLISSQQMRDDLADYLAKRSFLEQHYIVKENFMHGGRGTHFPGERKLDDDGKVYVKKNKYSTFAYILQQYHELPRKLMLNDQGVSYGSVDIRAYVTVSPTTRSTDIQLFAREGSMNKTSNVSQGGSFAKVVIVPDNHYFDLQKDLYKSILHLGERQRESLLHSIKQYAQTHLRLLPGSQISPIPFLISQSAYNRVDAFIADWLRYAVKTNALYEDEGGNLRGITLAGIDISLNPLPKE